MALTTEFMLTLGLNEEQIKKIFAEHGKSFAKYSDYEEIKEVNKKLTEENKNLKEIETSFEKIKKDNEKYKTDLAELEKTNELNIKKMSVKMNLKDVHDQEIVLNMLDLSKIELDENGNISSGLDEQLSTIKENKSFLFIDQKKFEGTKPAQGNTAEDKDNEETDPFVAGFVKGFEIE